MLLRFKLSDRLKLEEEERKRLEDKARRDAIFEKYMRRKMAGEGITEGELLPSTPSPPVKAAPQSAQVVLRKKSGTNRQGSTRPLSQPPPSIAHALPPGAGKLAAGGEQFGSHASEENLLDAEAMSYMSRSTTMLV